MYENGVLVRDTSISDKVCCRGKSKSFGFRREAPEFVTSSTFCEERYVDEQTLTDYFTQLVNRVVPAGHKETKFKRYCLAKAPLRVLKLEARMLK